VLYYLCLTLTILFFRVDIKHVKPLHLCFNEENDVADPYDLPCATKIIPCSVYRIIIPPPKICLPGQLYEVNSAGTSWDAGSIYVFELIENPYVDKTTCTDRTHKEEKEKDGFPLLYIRNPKTGCQYEADNTDKIRIKVVPPQSSLDTLEFKIVTPKKEFECIDCSVYWLKIEHRMKTFGEITRTRYVPLYLKKYSNYFDISSSSSDD